MVLNLDTCSSGAKGLGLGLGPGPGGVGGLKERSGNGCVNEIMYVYACVLLERSKL